MCRTKLCVPAGTFVHASAGEIGSPACVCFTGICAPSANAVVVSVSAGVLAHLLQAAVHQRLPAPGRLHKPAVRLQM